MDCNRCTELERKSEAIAKVRYVWLASRGLEINGQYPTPWEHVCEQCFKIKQRVQNVEARLLKESK